MASNQAERKMLDLTRQGDELDRVKALKEKDWLHLSEFIQVRTEPKVDGKPQGRWTLAPSAWGRRLELGGDQIRCPFCLGPIRLYAEDADDLDSIPHMKHEPGGNKTHCLVGSDYPSYSGIQRADRLPRKPGEPENPEVRLLLVEIANNRAPQSQYPGTDQVLVDLVARARKAMES